MLTYDKLEHLLSQAASHAADRGESMNPLRNQDDQIVIWPKDDSLVRCRLVAEGEALVLVAVLGTLTGQRREQIYEKLLAWNFLWAESPIKFAVFARSAVVCSNYPTQDMHVAELDAYLQGIKELAMEFTAVLENLEDSDPVNKALDSGRLHAFPPVV